MKFLNEVQIQGYVARTPTLLYDDYNKTHHTYFTLYTPPIQPLPTKENPLVLVKSSMTFYVKAYGKFAKYLTNALTTGNLVIVYGVLINKRYKSSQTKLTSNFVYISARRVYFKNEKGEFQNVTGESEVNET